MWAVSQIQPRPILTKPPLIPLTLTVSAKSHLQNGAFSSENIGGLGHTVISPLNSSSNSIPKQQEQEKQNQENQKEEGRELSGSDVLWAMQRAAAKKKNNKNKNKKRRESSFAGGNIQEDDAVDYTNVRPLRIKSEWGVKLNDLEKRLQELSETT